MDSAHNWRRLSASGPNDQFGERVAVAQNFWRLVFPLGCRLRFLQCEEVLLVAHLGAAIMPRRTSGSV